MFFILPTLLNNRDDAIDFFLILYKKHVKKINNRLPSAEKKLHLCLSRLFFISKLLFFFSRGKKRGTSHMEKRK
jgi:hypothetical protein